MKHQPIHALRSRETRRKVNIPVQMRAGGGWVHMNMLDVSSHGLSMQGSDPPPLGSYIEVRRGGHVLVARVVWRTAGRVGARTQDVVPVGAITGERDEGQAAARTSATQRGTECRTQARLPGAAEIHERSRQAGRSMEYSFLLVAIASAAVLCAGLVQTAIAEPLTIVTAALQ